MEEDRFNPNSNLNPSSGLFGRNPTHVDIANEAANQDEIVKAIKGSGAKEGQVTWYYDKVDPDIGAPPCSGITKIRNMSESEVEGFCQNLMRTRPNIYRLHLILGKYPNKRKIDNPKTNQLSSRKPRFPREIGNKLATVLSDKSLYTTEIIYTVHNTEPGFFNATAEVFGVSEADYYNDELFSPAIRIDFVKTT
jgi:hypothetical protein